MKRIFLHTLTIRIWHWVNAGIVILLTVTGIQLRVPGISILGAYGSAVLLHKYAGFAMAASFLLWLGYSVISRNLRQNYLVRGKDITSLYRQARFYMFGIFMGDENPFTPSASDKFNALQKIAYGSVMFLFTPIMVITGVLFSDMFYFRTVIELIRGPRVLDAIHVIVAYVFLLYLVVHIYMSTLGGSALSHIKAMLSGYEEEPDENSEQ